MSHESCVCIHSHYFLLSREGNSVAIWKRTTKTSRLWRYHPPYIVSENPPFEAFLTAVPAIEYLMKSEQHFAAWYQCISVVVRIGWVKVLAMFMWQPRFHAPNPQVGLCGLRLWSQRDGRWREESWNWWQKPQRRSCLRNQVEGKNQVPEVVSWHTLTHTHTHLHMHVRTNWMIKKKKTSGTEPEAVHTCNPSA